jgi:hypothetical protein
VRAEGSKSTGIDPIKSTVLSTFTKAPVAADSSIETRGVDYVEAQLPRG